MRKNKKLSAKEWEALNNRVIAVADWPRFPRWFCKLCSNDGLAFHVSPKNIKLHQASAEHQENLTLQKLGGK